jgi:hypothetical protein
VTDRHSWVYYAVGDRKGRNSVNQPEQAPEEKSAPEIRGGNRQVDWMESSVEVPDKEAQFIPNLDVHAGLASAKGGVPQHGEGTEPFEDDPELQDDGDNS